MVAPVRRPDEHGFTVLESVIGLGLVAVILVGLLGTMTSSVKAIVTGRQRSVAVALANEVMEQARGLSYRSVGHDLAALPALLAARPDPALSQSGSRWHYAGAPGEALVASPTPVTPFSPHRWSRTTDGTTYDLAVYVTLVTPAATTADPYKRVSVVVRWNAAQYRTTAIRPEVRVTSFLYEAEQPPDPLLTGLSDVEAGRVKVTGYLRNLDLQEASLWLPASHGEVVSEFIARANGNATTSRSELNTSLSVTELEGCAVGNSNKRAECAGVKADSVADNDAGSQPGENDIDGPHYGGVTAALGRSNGTFTMTLSGADEVTSKSTARSCLACAAVGDDDRLPYQDSRGSGPATSASVDYEVQGPGVTGRAVRVNGNAVATSIVDRDVSGTNQQLCSRSTVSHPSVDVLPFVDPVSNLLGTVLGSYAGLVRVGTGTVTATACAGPSVAAPSVTTGPITVQLFQLSGLGLLGSYRTVTVTPGVAMLDATSTLSLSVAGASVTVWAEVESRPKVVRSTTSGSTTTHAEASLANWLEVRAYVRVTVGGTVYADLQVNVDYGRVSAEADYEPAS